MLEQLKEAVCKANLQLPAYGLSTFTWGNVSGIDRKSGLVVIKPSGIPYTDMKPEDMSVVDISTGKIKEGRYKPSSDTPTHMEMYRRWILLAALYIRIPGGRPHGRRRDAISGIRHNARGLFLWHNSMYKAHEQR